VTSMIFGAWCQQPGVGGWVLMGLFWATFVGLVLWALSRLFAPGGDDVIHRDGDDPDQRWAQRPADDDRPGPPPVESRKISLPPRVNETGERASKSLSARAGAIQGPSSTGHQDPERGSLPGSGAGHGEPAAVGLRQSSGDRQVDAGPAVGPVPGGVDP